ncbi:MAG: hypothetical protein WKF31_03960 [Thermoleophilaceae bacterium]
MRVRAALAAHPHLLRIEGEVGHVEEHELLSAQPGAVGQLDQRPVPHLERLARRDAGQ